MMGQSDDILDTPQLDYEAWRDLLRAMCGRYNPEGIEPNAFTGWVRPVSVCGFTALDIVGDVALVDAARPVTYFANNGSEPWNTVTLNLPRESLVSHLGFDPPGGICRRGVTTAGRLLFELIRNTDKAEGSAFSPADSYMQLAVYDLVGALFAPSDPWPVSRYADKLFARIRGVIKDRFADPDFGPSEVAAEAGISLRYLQKLFTERGSTCSEFVYSLRLDHAARLLHRRALLNTSQPLSEIAYTCGFSDYTHFARKFRRRFGHPPGAHRRPGRDRTAESASLAHDVYPPVR
jgi:AraC-like DNA-binding protein